METVVDIVLSALQSGLASLASYLAAHVLLCLVPAFFIAGALSALVPQQSIIRFLGPDAPKWVSLRGWLYEHLFSSRLDDASAASLAFALSYVLFWLFLMIPLYHRRVFIKV